MTAFKPGDKVLIHARMGHPTATDGVYFVTIDCGRIGVSVPASALLPAPGPLYVDPELIPGMVVAPNDEVDARRWFVFDETRGGEFRPPHLIGFRDVLGEWSARHELPVEIRVVFDPRKATS
jgi:hypothetical protein